MCWLHAQPTLFGHTPIAPSTLPISKTQIQHESNSVKQGATSPRTTAIKEEEAKVLLPRLCATPEIAGLLPRTSDASRHLQNGFPKPALHTMARPGATVALPCAGRMSLTCPVVASCPRSFGTSPRKAGEAPSNVPRQGSIPIFLANVEAPLHRRRHGFVLESDVPGKEKATDVAAKPGWA